MAQRGGHLGEFRVAILRGGQLWITWLDLGSQWLKSSLLILWSPFGPFSDPIGPLWDPFGLFWALIAFSSDCFSLSFWKKGKRTIQTDNTAGLTRKTHSRPTVTAKTPSCNEGLHVATKASQLQFTCPKLRCTLCIAQADGVEWRMLRVIWCGLTLTAYCSAIVLPLFCDYSPIVLRYCSTIVLSFFADCCLITLRLFSSCL